MAQIKKKTVKDLLEQYATSNVKFTPIQFLTLLRCFCRKKDGTTSEMTQKMLAPLYAELTAGRMPLPALVQVVLSKMDRPFFRRKKNPGGEENTKEMAKTPGSRVKSSNFATKTTKSTVTKPGFSDDELRKKLNDQWRNKLAESYKAGDRDLRLKSVGNGL